MSGDDFNWHEDESVVLEPRLGLAIYVGDRGDVVLRQQGSYPDDDVWIFFPACDAEIVAQRILKVAREARALKAATRAEHQCTQQTSGHLRANGHASAVLELPLGSAVHGHSAAQEGGG